MQYTAPVKSAVAPAATKRPVADAAVPPKTTPVKGGVLVAGSVAIDLNCDYVVPKAGDVAVKDHTSNPARITQTIGGVGHNVALAAARANAKSPVTFCSLVGNDV